MTTTPRLGITQLEEGQALPEAVVNEADLILEQMASSAIVKDKDLATPPGSPAEGDAYIVASSATGAWTGWEGRIAFYASGWIDITPIEGTEAYVQDENIRYRYDGAAWVSAAGASDLDDLTDVNAPTPTNGQVLTWDSTPGEWVAQDLPAAGAFVLDDATDVNAPTPSNGDVLTWDSTPGEWVAQAPSAGSAAWALAGSGQTATGIYDFAVDGAKANVDFTGLSAYNELLVICRALTTTVSGVRQIRVSVDNGSTFYGTSGDYVALSSGGVESNTDGINHSQTGSTAARSLVVHIVNTKGAVKVAVIHQSAAIMEMFVASTSDVNAVRLFNNGGGNINGGTARVYAR